MRYRITSLDAARAIAVQEMDAMDEGDAWRQAQARGLRILTIEHARLKLSRRRARLGLVPFTNELVALLDAGLSLVEAIEALTEKERDAAVRSVLEAIRGRLYEGQSFSVALGEFPSSFPTLYVATVRASERSGSIPLALKRFVTYQERIDLLKQQLINASIYPAVLLCVGSLVVLFLVGYVVPRFAGIYEEIGGDLPLASRMLMQWGRLLEAHGLLVFGGFAALAVIAVQVSLRPASRAAVGRQIARIPNDRPSIAALPACAALPNRGHAAAWRSADRHGLRHDRGSARSARAAAARRRHARGARRSLAHRFAQRSRASPRRSPSACSASASVAATWAR